MRDWICKFAAISNLFSLCSAIAIVTFCPTAAAQESSATVRGTRIGDTEQTPAAVTSIDLTQSGRTAPSLGPLLDEAPGLQVRSTGDALSPTYATLRGSSTAQVTVAIDGIILNDAFAPSVDLSSLAPAMFVRADVYRGTAPLRLGLQGLAGTIELHTRDVDRRTPAWISLAGGSFWQRRMSAYVAARAGSLRALTTVSYRGTNGDFLFFDDHATPSQPADDQRNQVRQNASSNGLNVLFRGCASVLCLWAIGDARLGGLPGPGSLQFRETYLTQGRLLTRLSARVARQWGAIELYGSTQWRRDVFGDPLSEVSSVGAQTQGRVNEAGLSLSAREDALSFSATTRVRQESFFSGEQSRPRISALGGAELSMKWRTLELQSGLGVEVLAHGADAVAPLPTLVLGSPRLGIRWHPTRWLSLRGTLSQLERAPTLIELFGIGEFIRPNSALKPESSTSVDLGAVLEPQLDRVQLRFELTGYARRATQLIALSRTSALALKALNLRDATILGVESQLRVQLFGHARLTASYAYTYAVTDASVLSGGGRVPNIPEHDLYVRVEGNWRWLRIGANLSWVAGVFFDSANLYAAPSRALAGLNIGFVPPIAQKLTIELSANNLFDLRESIIRGNSQAISDFAGYPLPSRSFVLSVQTEL